MHVGETSRVLEAKQLLEGFGGMRLTRVLCKSTFEFWFDGVKGENKFKL
jgi:hypothetical protein